MAAAARGARLSGAGVPEDDDPIGQRPSAMIASMFGQKPGSSKKDALSSFHAAQARPSAMNAPLSSYHRPGRRQTETSSSRVPPAHFNSKSPSFADSSMLAEQNSKRFNVNIDLFVEPRSEALICGVNKHVI